MHSHAFKVEICLKKKTSQTRTHDYQIAQAGP